jgi:pimeloyl-ACP methyl ester carboxylesterase
MWEPQLVLAEQGWHVVAPHFRGFDGTPVDAQTTMDDYVGDVLDLMETLHINSAVVAGVSMGGYAAFALLRHARSAVRGLVLADTKAFADTPAARCQREAMIALVRQRGAEALAEEMLPALLGDTTRREQPALVERVRALIRSNTPDAIAGALHALMSRSDSTPLLPSIDVPTLIIVGEEDVLTPPALSREMQCIIPAAEFVVIPQAGHLSNIEQPEAFNAAVARFLRHRV